MALYCPRCRIPMKEQKRSFHKRRKWICPRCRFVRFQALKEVIGATSG